MRVVIRFFVLAGMIVVVGAANALSIRHDVADSQYTAAAASIPVAVIDYNTVTYKVSGILINDRYVLTAAHKLRSDVNKIRINGVDYTRVTWVKHPEPPLDLNNLLNGYDFSIIKLNTRVLNIAPIPIYESTYGGGTVTIAGAGVLANGTNGYTNDGTYIPRAGQNKLEIDSSLPNVFISDFDNAAGTGNSLDFLGSQATPTARECNVIYGDSGGPCIATIASKQYVVATTSTLADFNENSKLADYGDLSFYSRVSMAATWIKDNSWEPGRVEGIVSLSQLAAGATPLNRQLTVKLRNVGSQASIETINLPLAINGGFSFVTSQRGSFDLLFSCPGFLDKKVANITITNTSKPVVNVTLGNGDCDDDNEVGAGDFDIVVGNFANSTTDPTLGDLDGDGEVGSGDFDIVVNNFTNSGDV